MKILISPAKSLDFESPVPVHKTSELQFKDKAIRLNKALKTKSAKKLMSLMHISENLGQLNYNRNQDFKPEFTEENSRQAIFAFNGEVYNGLDAYNLNEASLDYLQANLRILSGLYGILKPYDLIQPYRLEMGTSLKVNTHANLYSFWKNDLAKALNNELQKEEAIINLASNEYFKALDKKQLSNPVITPVFKDFSNNQYKVISFFAKKARGLMVNFMAENKISKPEELKHFNFEGYNFDVKSSTESQWVFLR